MKYSLFLYFSKISRKAINDDGGLVSKETVMLHRWEYYKII